MNKKQIETDYLKKIKKLTKLNEYYYSHSKPLVEDIEYDLLKKKILILENKYNFLNSKDYCPRCSRNCDKLASRILNRSCKR